MKEYKVGDKVRVRADLKPGEKYYVNETLKRAYGCYTKERITRMSSVISTIVKCTPCDGAHYYQLSEDIKTGAWPSCTLIDCNFNTLE